ncbi:MAG: DUF1565 domain-containing protein, partial [Planctomycetes bacterium]|nr:DUF1565 domain-containing protein [Planctomycetota bacterium]
MNSSKFFHRISLIVLCFVCIIIMFVTANAQGGYKADHFSTPAPGIIYYVDDDYGNPYPGSGTPTDPFWSIQTAITAATFGDTVQVAAGTYNETIIMESGVVVMGTGPPVCTINGGGSGSVVIANSVDSAARLVGFTITNGDALKGGGMFIINCSPTIINCTFSDNQAEDFGGGMYNLSSSPVITNCTFTGNSTYPLGHGGGMYNDNSNPKVTDCTFYSNSADSTGNGGGMYNDNSSPEITG